MVNLNAQGWSLEAQAVGELGIKYDGGSTSSISEFVATSDARRSAVEDNSILYVATRTSLLMCVIILLSFGVIEVLRCLAKEWRIYRYVTTRRRSGLRLTSVDMMESGESPRVGPEQAREAPEAPEGEPDPEPEAEAAALPGIEAGGDAAKGRNDKYDKGI
jgi:hypothetical protein